MMDLLLVAVANISSALEKMGIDILIFTIPLIMLGTFQLRPKNQKGFTEKYFYKVDLDL